MGTSFDSKCRRRNDRNILLTKMKLHTFGLCLLLGLCAARPQQTTVVVTTTGPTTTTTTPTTTTTEAATTSSVAPKKAENVPKPIIDRLNIQSEIQFRYSKTVIESRIKNPSTSSAQEVEFEMVLPEKA